MEDGECVGLLVKCVSLSQACKAIDRSSPDAYRIRNKIQTQYVRGSYIEGRISNSTRAVRDLGNYGHGAQQMRLIRRSPFRHCPESIHHPAWSIGKFIGKPPLIAEGSVS